MNNNNNSDLYILLCNINYYRPSAPSPKRFRKKPINGDAYKQDQQRPVIQHNRPRKKKYGQKHQKQYNSYKQQEQKHKQQNKIKYITYKKVRPPSSHT